MLRVVLIDDHNLFAEAMKVLFTKIKIADLTDTYPNHLELFKLSPDDWPDIILLDLNLEGITGLDVCKLIKSKVPLVKVVVLTMVNEFSMVRALINAGASGYLLKNTNQEELEQALKEVMNDRIFFGRQTKKEAVGSVTLTRAKKYTITKREKEVLELITLERTTNEISEILGIAFTTVETHRKNLIIKLGVRNTAGLVKVAIEEKLI